MGWNPPVVLKPLRQGSSVGLQFVERVGDWSKALAEVLRYDSQVLMEERISGRETTVGILGNQALPLVEVRPKTGIYDYQTKYTPGTTDYLCPAPFDEETTARVQAAGLAAFRAIGGRDYARVDIIVRPEGEPVVLDHVGGQPLVHAAAVDRNIIRALCGTAAGRLLLTGWLWHGDHPPHMDRCQSCLNLFPLETSAEPSQEA